MSYRSSRESENDLRNLPKRICISGATGLILQFTRNSKLQRDMGTGCQGVTFYLDESCSVPYKIYSGGKVGLERMLPAVINQAQCFVKFEYPDICPLIEVIQPFIFFSVF